MNYRHLYKTAAPTQPAQKQTSAQPQQPQQPAGNSAVPKLNMNKMPGLGDSKEYREMWWNARRAQERDNALNEYQKASPDIKSKYKTADEYAEWKMNQNRWRWDPNAARRYIGEGYTAGRKDVEANTSRDWYTLWMTKNIDEDWLMQNASQKTPTDPVEFARWRNYQNAVSGAANATEAETSANANAGMYVAGKTLDGVTAGVGNVGGRFTEAVTGQTQDELATEFGEFAGQGAEQMLRGAGTVAEVGASLPTYALAGSAAGALKAANPVVTVGGKFAPALQRLATYGTNVAGNTLNTYRTLKPVGRTLTNLSDTIDNGSKTESGTASFIGNTGRIMGGVAESIADTAPYYTAVGSLGTFGKIPGIIGKSVIPAELALDAPELANEALLLTNETYRLRNSTIETQKYNQQQLDEISKQYKVDAVQAKQIWSAFTYSDWDNNILAKYPEAANNPDMMNALRIQTAIGAAKAGSMLPNGVFDLPGMNQEQRTQIFETWAANMGAADTSAWDATKSLFNGKFVLGDQYKHEKFQEMLKNNPQFRETADQFMSTSVAHYVQNPTKEAMDPDSLMYFNEYCETIGQAGVDKVMAGPFSQLSPEQWSNLINQQGNAGANPMVQRAATKQLLNEVNADPAKGGALLPVLIDQMKQGKGGYATDQELKPKINAMLKSWDQEKFDKFAEAGIDAFEDDEQFYTFAKSMVSGSSDALDGVPDEAKAKLEAGFTKAVKSRVFDSVLKNPGNMHKAVGLWLRTKGQGGMADSIENNPLVFYGGLALLVGGVGALTLGAFSGNDDEEEEDDDAAYKKRVRGRYMNSYGTPYTTADIMRSLEYGE